MSVCGRAPEILQASIKAANPEPTPAAAATPLPPVAASQPESPPEPDAQVAEDENKPVDPKVAELEILPDEDLTKLVQARSVKVDGRWSRARLISEILHAADNPPPPPPALVVPPPTPAPVPEAPALAAPVPPPSAVPNVAVPPPPAA